MSLEMVQMREAMELKEERVVASRLGSEGRRRDWIDPKGSQSFVVHGVGR